MTEATLPADMVDHRRNGIRKPLRKRGIDRVERLLDATELLARQYLLACHVRIAELPRRVLHELAPTEHVIVRTMSLLCFKVNAFCAFVNLDAFGLFSPLASREIRAQDAGPRRFSSPDADHFQGTNAQGLYPTGRRA